MADTPPTEKGRRSAIVVPLLEHNAKAYQSGSIGTNRHGDICGNMEIRLGRWLYEQKVLLRRQSPKLNAEQIDTLRKLPGEEPAEKAG